MRLPVLPPAVPEFDLDRYEIAQKAPISPSKNVTEEVLPVMPRPVRGGGQGAGADEQTTPSTGGGEAVVQERGGGDRRSGDRRVKQVPVLLDTRTGVERRKGPRRSDDPVTHISEKV